MKKDFKNKDLYYSEGDFYWVKQTDKTICVEWIPHYNVDSSESDQNVDYEKLIVKKDNSGKHSLEEIEENNILIYPFRNGQPFYLELATQEHIIKEIKDCERWGGSSRFYKDLEKFI